MELKNKIYLFLSLLKNKFLSVNLIFKHLILSVIVLLFLFIIWIKYLDYYTQHKQYIQVPDFTGLHLTDLDSFSQNYNLRYVILDSIYDKNKLKGTVVSQEPLAFTDVKNQRRVYLTVTTLNSPKIIFPNIYDFSLRQAVDKLEKCGFEIGELIYKNNLAANKILNFSVNGIKIKPGKELYVGTRIDLIVGSGLGVNKVYIPDLEGLTRYEANSLLKASSLNIGTEIFNSSVIDSSDAIIYMQSPRFSKRKIRIGSSIDLFYRRNDIKN